MSDAVSQSSDGFYRLLMDVREKVVSVEAAQKQLAMQFQEFQDDFEGYKSWSQRMLYGVVVLLVVGALILLALILTGRI